MVVRFGSNAARETYHAGMLLYKERPVLPGAESAGESRGMASLAALERGGLLKRVTPLAPEPAAGLPGAESVATVRAGELGAPQPLAGVNLVELERDSDVEALRAALAGDPTIEAVSRVPIRYLVARQRSKPAEGDLAAPSAAAPEQPPKALWNLVKIRWTEARALPGFKDATDIHVGVLDTGVDETHPDLQGRIASYTFAHPDLPGVSGKSDLIGHGTHVAGTIGALINNDIGIQGICSPRLHIWKIFDDQPDFDASRNEFAYFVDPVMYRRALFDCLVQGIQVINLSIGGTGKPDFLEQSLFGLLVLRGTTIVAAMGNERAFGSPTSYPAAIPGVIAVGATSINDMVASFSNAGNHIALSAPGVGIWSTLPASPGQFGFANAGTPDNPQVGAPQARETHYGCWDGTSMATPHVTAAAALLLANQGGLDGGGVRQRLMAAADKVASMLPSAPDPDYGAGRLNLLRLLSV
jgi:subtilisin family serine protease